MPYRRASLSFRKTDIKLLWNHLQLIMLKDRCVRQDPIDSENFSQFLVVGCYCLCYRVIEGLNPGLGGIGGRRHTLDQGR